MSDFDISKICVRFTLDDQDTSMMIREADDGTYEVNALYHRTCDSGFPAQEMVKCDGRVYQDDVDGLVRTMRTICEPSWFHHYVGSKTRRALAFPTRLWLESRWSVLIEHTDGTRYRWEGINDAPATLSGVYDLLVSFGMPPLKLGYSGLAGAFGTMDKGDELERIQSYLALFAEVQSEGPEDGPQDEFELLAQEFVDDVRCYVALCREKVPSMSTMAQWGAVTNLEKLEAMDVQHTTRDQMLAFLDALTQAGDPVEIATHVLETGMLKRWCERLAALPKEEAHEERQRYEQEQERISQSVDDAIRKRIAQKKVFTARDVAEDVNASTQKASMHIRAFVRSGELQTVGTEYPRKYRAA